MEGNYFFSGCFTRILCRHMLGRSHQGALRPKVWSIGGLLHLEADAWGGSKSCRRGGAKDPWFGTLDHRRKESASDLLFGGLGSRKLTTGDAKDLWVGILDHRFKESASDLLFGGLGSRKLTTADAKIFGLGS